MIRFFLSYFLAMLVLGVLWHRFLTYVDMRIRQRRIQKSKRRVCPSVGECLLRQLAA